MLFDGVHRPDQFGGGVHPAHFPPSQAEGLATRGDGYRAFGHPGQGCQRNVAGAVVGHVLVDLVGNHHEIVGNG